MRCKTNLSLFPDLGTVTKLVNAIIITFDCVNKYQKGVRLSYSGFPRSRKSKEFYVTSRSANSKKKRKFLLFVVLKK